jgi:hypothetical protein
MGETEIVDRYSATGIAHPDENSCKECEGMGVLTCEATELNKYACESSDGRVVVIGQKEKDGTPVPDDGWLFLQCPICKGTRKKQVAPNKEE